MYLTATHVAPPAHVIHDGARIPTAPLIARGDDATLAALGIYPHHTEDGPAPLGYTEWDLIDGAYYRQPDGTEQQIADAIAAQAAAAHDAYLDGLECTRLQGKLALIAAGLWDQYESLIATMLPTMSAAQRVFVEDAPTWKFRDPVLQAFAAAIEGLGESELVALFEHARTL